MHFPQDSAQPWIKVCGITLKKDADCCAAAGVSAIGINFFPKSKRYIPLHEALEWLPAGSGGPMLVALFVNASLATIQATVDSGRFHAIQLHGDESPEFLTETKHMGLPVLRALALRSDADLVKLERFAADAYILDAHAPGTFGGTGMLSDWSLAAAAVQRFPEKTLILSGGITAENAAKALADVRPHGLDLASGVETAPGRKDPALIRSLMEAVKVSGAPVRA